jgi:hypothetical protein
MTALYRLWKMVALTFAAGLIALAQVTVTLAQAVGSDGDGLDGDEFWVVAVLLGAAVVGAIAWTTSRRRSGKPR